MITIFINQLLQETKKAFLVELRSGRKCWIPKDAVSHEGINDFDENFLSLRVNKQFVKKNKL